LLVRTALSALNCHWLQLSHGVLLRSADGGAERELRATYERALSLAPSCIVLDDMDLLCLSRSSPHISDVQKRIVACLLSLMDGVSSHSENASARVFFVGTTSRVDDIDAAVRRFGRMDREIEIGAPTVEDRVKILQRLLQLSGTHLTRSDADDSSCDDVSAAAIVRAISQQAHGMVASDLVRVVKEAAHLSWKESRCAALDGVAASSAEEVKPMEALMQALSLTEAAVSPAQSTHNRGPVITERSLMLAVKKIQPSALREVAIEVPKVRWSDIGGMDEVKRSLREVLYDHGFIEAFMYMSD
jgi:AAA family ATPase